MASSYFSRALSGIGFSIVVAFVLGIIIYLTKLSLDKSHYTDAEKAGIYIAVIIPGFIAAYLISIILVQVLWVVAFYTVHQ